MKNIFFVVCWIIISWLAPASQAQCGDPLNCSTVVSSFPYFENFENGQGGWYHGAIQANYPLPEPFSPSPYFGGTPISDSWAIGTPAKAQISSAFSGSNCWVTGLTGTYSSQEHSYVASPCYNFSTLKAPFLSLRINYYTETFRDGAVIQVSVDAGQSWDRLGEVYPYLNWYNSKNIAASPGRICIPANREGWAGQSDGWEFMLHDLFVYAGQASVKFRIVFASDNLTHHEGFAFDDIGISDGPITQGNQPHGLLGIDTAICIPRRIGFPTPQNANIQFLWSTGDTTPSIELATGGLYWLETSAGNQVSRDTVIITALASPIPSLASDTAFCFESSINARVIIPYTNAIFRLYDSAQMQFVPSPFVASSPHWVISTTTIEATHLTQRGCIIRDTVLLAEMPPLTIDTIHIWPDFGLSDGAAKALYNGSFGTPQFDWGPLGNGQTTDSIFYLPAGSDTLTITDVIGCQARLAYEIPTEKGIYPGDTDHNQVVNMNDLLPIGISAIPIPTVMAPST